MRTALYKTDVQSFIDGAEEFSISDIKTACPEVPVSSIYACVHTLVTTGAVSIIGKGRYSKTPKLLFAPTISQWMKDVHSFMLAECTGVNSCIYESGHNLHVDVSKEDITTVTDTLKNAFKMVVTGKDASLFPAELEGYIIVGKIVGDAPLYTTEEGIQVPTVEKKLVDAIKKDADTPSEAIHLLYQKTFEQYAINRNKLARYAARRGLLDRLNRQLNLLNEDRLTLFSRLQTYLSSIPVAKAWVFGSFARGEETASSDIDLLVSYDSDAKVSLLNVVRYKLDMEALTNRKIDLVEEGYLRDFARESANHDKYLIYERAS